MKNGNPAWAELTREEHEYQYNPQAAFPHFAEVRARLAPHNQAARAALGAPLEVAYGDHPLHRLDIFRADGPEPRPVHVFYHGGYWRAQDKQNFAFVAGALVPLGITTVVVNYELCPGSDLRAVTRSAVNSFRWICSNIGEHGGNAERLTLSGHSAGAHLGAAILADTKRPMRVAGAVLTSGIFDPRPAIGTTVNAELRLTEDIAAATDMERRPPSGDAEVSLQVGALETPHWVDQTYRYYAMLRQRGMTPELHVLPRHDHFDILEDYLVPTGMTVTTIRRHCGVMDAAR